MLLPNCPMNKSELNKLPRTSSWHAGECERPSDLPAVELSASCLPTRVPTGGKGRRNCRAAGITAPSLLAPARSTIEEAFMPCLVKMVRESHAMNVPVRDAPRRRRDKSSWWARDVKSRYCGPVWCISTSQVFTVANRSHWVMAAGPAVLLSSERAHRRRRCWIRCIEDLSVRSPAR